MAADLAKQQLISYPRLFKFYVRLHQFTYLKTGEYFFPHGATANDILKQVTKGKGLVYRTFTIIPGWSLLTLKQSLQTTFGLNHDPVTLTDSDLKAALGDPPFLEGQFFPDTYYFTRGVTDLVILKKSFALMQKQLTTAWQARANNLPYHHANEALIAASLIEKEAHLESERPIIASVLVNRLQKGMRLQFDPTVIYGMGERYQGTIYKSDLIEKTPFNTYINKGLPPTPIAMPSLAALEAALHPAKTPYFYFVARGDGSHQFSATLKAHQAAAAAIKVNLHVIRPYFNQPKMQDYVKMIMIHPHATALTYYERQIV